MIKSKQDLKEYISADRSRYSLRKPRLLGYILSDESYFVTKYLKVLRLLEYYTNKKRKWFEKIIYAFLLLRHRRLSLKLGIRINPNVVGKGVYIPHFRGGVIINALQMGEYCTVNSGVVVGNKSHPENKPTIGNNVELTIGCKVIGKIKIGNNCIVAPNSVVINDLEDNSIVSGVPAKLIKKI